MRLSSQLVPAPRGALESRLFAPSTSRQGPAHGVLGDRTPEQTLDRLMYFCTAHRSTGGRQHLDDGPLDHAIAEPSYVELWLGTRGRLDWLIGQGLEHRRQVSRGV
jgi:hypothetical protein